MLFMATGGARALYAAHSGDGFRWRMLDDGRPVVTPGGGNAFDGDFAGHACLLRLGPLLRVWYTGYRREAGGVRGWKLRIGVADLRRFAARVRAMRVVVARTGGTPS